MRGGDTVSAAPVMGGALQEAVTALIVLGYSEGEAAQALAGADPNATVEELIKKALIALAKF